MGRGTAASSFMTGFMSGYKFIDGIQAKKDKAEVAKQEAEAKLKKDNVDMNKSITTEVDRVTAKLDELEKAKQAIRLKSTMKPENRAKQLNAISDQEAALIEPMSKQLQSTSDNTKTDYLTPFAQKLEGIDMRHVGSYQQTDEDGNDNYFFADPERIKAFDSNNLLPDTQQHMSLSSQGVVNTKVLDQQIGDAKDNAPTYSDVPTNEQWTPVAYVPKTTTKSTETKYSERLISSYSEAEQKKLKAEGYISTDTISNATAVSFLKEDSANEKLWNERKFLLKKQDTKGLSTEEKRNLANLNEKLQTDTAIRNEKLELGKNLKDGFIGGDYTKLNIPNISDIESYENQTNFKNTANMKLLSDSESTLAVGQRLTTMLDKTKNETINRGVADNIVQTINGLRSDDAFNDMSSEDKAKHLSTVMAKTSIGNALAQYIKTISGTAVADAEYERLSKIFTTGDYNNIQSVRQAVTTFYDDLGFAHEQRLKDNVRAGGSAVLSKLRVHKERFPSKDKPKKDNPKRIQQGGNWFDAETHEFLGKVK
jgi:hypothetical protein